MAAGDHGAADHGKQGVQGVSQSLGTKGRKEIGNQQQHGEHQRQGTQIPYKMPLRNRSLMQKQSRRQEEQKGQSGEKNSHGGFVTGIKPPMAHRIKANAQAMNKLRFFINTLPRKRVKRTLLFYPIFTCLARPFLGAS